MAKTEWHVVEDPRAKQVWDQTEDQLVEIFVNKKKLVLVRWQGQLYCLDARCPHAGGPLGAGAIGDAGELVCPWHRFRFDLSSGTCAKGGYYVNTYPVKIEDRRLMIAFPKKSFWRFGW